MKRKLIVLFLVLAMTASMALLMPVSAAEAGPATAVDATVSKDSIVVSVSVENCPALSNGRLSITYDENSLILTAAEVVGPCAVSSLNLEAAGEVTMAWVGSSLPAAKTAMVELTFAPVEGATGTVDFSVKAEQTYADGTAVALAPSSIQAILFTSPFTDIEGHWAEDEILEAYAKGLFKGMTDTTFVPDGPLTRAMFITVLYRYAGSPAVDGKTQFTDVKDNTFYADALIWATENGIVKGITKTEFAPHENISRQQVVTVLYRYAALLGMDVSARIDLSTIADGDQVMNYAKDAMSWAVAEGIVLGFDGNLLIPNGDTTRAQAATLLCRFGN